MEGGLAQASCCAGDCAAHVHVRVRVCVVCVGPVCHRQGTQSVISAVDRSCCTDRCSRTVGYKGRVCVH